jgi:hypothetical protein
MFAFFAALNVLDARALYSNHNVRDLMSPAIHSTKSSLERHHLFPVAYLKAQCIADQRDFNQIANFAIVEWGDNTAIAATPPSQYVPTLEARFNPNVVQEMYRHHALPNGWHTMSYDAFLRERRSRIAQTIRQAYEKLAGEMEPEPSPIRAFDLIASGETGAIEFKSTLRTNLHTGERDPRMEMAVLKSIAGFLNAKGGTLVVGVADNGTPVGLEKDGFADEDKMSLHLINLLKDRVGAQHSISIQPRFDDYGGVRVLVVDCSASPTAVYVKDGTVEKFFVRYGPSTLDLTGSAAQEYIKQRF